MNSYDVETKHESGDWQFRLVDSETGRPYTRMVPSLITWGPVSDYTPVWGYPVDGWVKTTAISRKRCKRYARWFFLRHLDRTVTEPIEREPLA